MEKKNGFTLIELLSILVILSVIAIITVPIITGTIDDAEKGTFEDQVYGMMRAAELDYTKGEFTEDVIYQVGNGKMTRSVPSLTEVEVKGKIDGTGSIIVAEDGNVLVSVYNDTWCASKTVNQSKVSLTAGTCAPLLIQKYQIGDQVRVKGLSETFHVIQEVGSASTMALILADTPHSMGAFSTGSNEFSGSLAEQELKEYTTTWKANIESAGGNTSGLVISIPSREELQEVRAFYGVQDDSIADAIDWLHIVNDGSDDDGYGTSGAITYTKSPDGTEYIWTYQWRRLRPGSPEWFLTKYKSYIRPTLYIDKSNLTKVS